MKYIAPLPRPHGRFTNVYVIKEAELSIDMSGETEEEELTSILSAYLFSCYFQLVTISFDKCNVTDTFAAHLSIRHLRVCHFCSLVCIFISPRWRRKTFGTLPPRCSCLCQQTQNLKTSIDHPSRHSTSSSGATIHQNRHEDGYSVATL